MSKVEKIGILGMLGSASLISAYFLLRPYAPSLGPDLDAADRRKSIINNPNIRVLYSSMSFFYLQTYENNAKSLMLLKDMLDVAKPKFVAVQLAEADFDAEYLRVLRHPQFLEAIKKVDYYLSTKDEQALTAMPELDVTKGIEHLYIANYCRLNACKVIYADEPYVNYEAMLKAKMRVQELAKDNTFSEEQLREQVYVNKRAEVFVDRIMEQLKPKFMLVPDTPYKVIVGIVGKDTTQQVVNTWKSKFMSVYGHQILEDNDVGQLQQ